MKHLQEHEARSSTHRPVTRNYPNGQSVEMLIHLPQSTWDYADWLEARGVISIQAWVAHCHANPSPGFTLSHLLMYWFWLDQCRRYRNGDDLPHKEVPDGYEAYGEAANDF